LGSVMTVGRSRRCSRRSSNGKRARRACRDPRSASSRCPPIAAGWRARAAETGADDCCFFHGWEFTSPFV
jgi:hypothetical protein